MISCHRNIVIVACIFALLLSCQSQSSLAQSNNNGGASSSVQANADANSKGASGSAQAAGSFSGNAGSLSAGANAASGGGAGDSGSSGASGGSASAGATLSFSQGQSTQKPEGIFGKLKGAVKSGVDSLTASKKNDNNQQPQQQQQQPQVQASGSASASFGSGDNQSQSNSGAGLAEKLGDAAKKAKDLVKEGAKEMRDDVKTVMGVNGNNGGNNNNNGGSSGGTGGSGGFSAGGSVKVGSSTIGGNVQIGASGKAEANAGGKQDSGKSEGPLTKLLNKVGDKATEFTEFTNTIGVGNSTDKSNNKGNNGGGNNGGSGSASASAGASSSGGSSAGASAQVKVNVNAGAGANGGINGNAQVNENKSLAVNLADKMHDVAKAPVEAVMKPLDKALGFEKDPLIKMYDDSHELIRKPLSVVAKPVETVLTGAFKTSEEAKQAQERLMSEQERRELKMKEDRARKEGRSVLGEITDKAVELAEKPYEIILKPVDKMLGFDKDGQKDPLIKLFDELYNISRKSIDVFAKPLENILKKMAEGDQAYQVSVRLNSGAVDSSDPKLLTRLADGALNIADRVVTKPLEFVMRPLGYNDKKKNPLVESTHQFKNATKLGIELFTKPIDRMIKEISDIGATKSPAEREADRERRRQEASRLVRVLDKLKEAAQTPWEIVLRPINRATGYSKEGAREPFLRAWDVLHQVFRTPIQIVSKPVEDAILGEQKQSPGASAKVGASGQVQIGANGGAAGSAASVQVGQADEKHRKNIFVDSVKKFEKLAVKPFDKITAPIRRLILGEDDKVGSGVNAKASVNTPNGKVQANAQVGGSNSGESDKLVKTLEKLNNVILKPFEAVSQPISDMLSSDDQNKKGNEVKAQAQVQVNGQQDQNKAAASASAQMKGGNNNNAKSGVNGSSGGGGQVNMSAGASAQAKMNNNNGGNSNNGQNNMSASAAASAQLKKN